MVEATLPTASSENEYGSELGENEPAGAVFGLPPRSLPMAVMYLD